MDGHLKRKLGELAFDYKYEQFVVELHICIQSNVTLILRTTILFEQSKVVKCKCKNEITNAIIYSIRTDNNKFKCD